MDSAESSFKSTISSIQGGPMNHSGYTGGLFEREVLGKCIVMWDGEYIPYNASMMLVKAGQPSDPSDPESRLMNDLHARMAMELGLDDWSELKFYTAIDSPLDYWHGVDAFFEFRGRVVTFDLTMNPNKDEWKANMIISPGHLENLELLAREIATKLVREAV